MVLLFITLCFVFLSHLVAYMQNEEVASRKTFVPNIFKINDVSYRDLFFYREQQEDIPVIRLAHDKFIMNIDPGLVLESKVSLNTNSSKSLSYHEMSELFFQLQPSPFRPDCTGSQYYNIDQAHRFRDSYITHCSKIEFILQDSKFINNQFMLYFSFLDTATNARTFLAFKVFPFVFMKDPVFLKNIFSPSKTMVHYFLVNNKELMVGSNLVGHTDNKMQLNYINEADFNFEYGIGNETNHFECAGIILKDPLSNAEVEYSWNVYRPDVPYYIAFYKSTNPNHIVLTPRYDIFNVKFHEYAPEIKDERFLFHLVCANGSDITLDSYTVDMNNVASRLPPSSIKKNDALRFHKLIKETTVNSPVQVKRFKYVPNKNPSLSPVLRSNQKLYFPPISVESSESYSGSSMQGYVEVQSSFIKEIKILNQQVPMDKLGSNSVKSLEFDCNLDPYDSLFEFIFQAYSSSIEVLSILTQIEVVVWPKNGNDFRNPFSIFFKPLTLNLIALGRTKYNFFVDSLYDKELFKKYELMKEIDRYKLEYRFFVSNSTYFTYFNIYLNPIQSTIEPFSQPSNLFENYFDKLTLQGKTLEIGQMTADCSKAKIFDLILAESMIFYSFKMKESVTDPNFDFKIKVLVDGIDLTKGQFKSKRTRDSFILLDIEALDTVYVDDLDNRLIQFYIHPEHHENTVVGPPVECIQARIHVPSYIYRLPTTSAVEWDEFLGQLYKQSILLPVQHERISDILVNIYLSSRSNLMANKKYPVPANGFFTSFFVQVKNKFESALQQALSSAGTAYSSLLSDFKSMYTHLNKLVETLLQLDKKDSPLVPYTSKEGQQNTDNFLVHLYEICTLVSENPKFLSLYARAMNSPRFQFLYPNRKYSNLEMERARMLSRMMTLCNYRKWSKEQTLG